MKRQTPESELPLTEQEFRDLWPQLRQELLHYIDTAVERIAGFSKLIATSTIMQLYTKSSGISLNDYSPYADDMANMVLIETRLKEIRREVVKDNPFLVNVIINNPSMRDASYIWPIVFNGTRPLRTIIDSLETLFKNVLNEWNVASIQPRIPGVSTLEADFPFETAFDTLMDFGRRTFPGGSDPIEQEYKILLTHAIKRAAGRVRNNSHFYDRVLAKKANLIELAASSPDTPTEVLQIINDATFPDVRQKLCTVCHQQAQSQDAVSGKLFCGTKCQFTFYQTHSTMSF